MKFKLIKSLAIAIAAFMATQMVWAQCKVNPGGRGWADSYSANGKCYCWTKFDHGIGNYKVNTPAGKKSVREICNKIGRGPGIGKNPIYNTVQCGHAPAHGDKAVKNSCGKKIADEKVCPGRVDQGSGGCNRKGPKWDLSVFGDKGKNNNGANKGSNNNSNNNNGGSKGLPVSCSKKGDKVCKQKLKGAAWCNVWNKFPKNTCRCGGRECKASDLK